MTQILLPAIWLVVLIAGLPQLSETVYTPSLPEIAADLGTSAAIAEYTLTIYLLGFALGSLFWGKLSDHFGRKPCILAGLVTFILGCVGCYFSYSIEILMASRLIQAFGGSIGSVLSQALCRDAFQGPALGKSYAAIGIALALFPALGPLCGGVIAESFGWRKIFIFLTIFALIVALLVSLKLPETHPHAQRKKNSIWDMAKQLIQDKNVVGYGLIVAGSNGIMFSYFAEGSFYMIQGLGLSPSYYGLSFAAIAVALMLGGFYSKKLLQHHSSKEIMVYGMDIMTVATLMFSIMILIHQYMWAFSTPILISTTMLLQMISAFGICMTTSNALALALIEYKHAIGTASSLFGFFYYCLISLFTLFMGLLHDGTLLPMPLYFFALCCFMHAVYRICLKKASD